MNTTDNTTWDTELHEVQEESIRLMQENVQSIGNADNVIDELVYENDRRKYLNTRYGKMGRVDMEKIVEQDTTEARLRDVRESMTFTRAKKTIRRTGWYFTELYAPCGIDDRTHGV